jgi:hypothetical protein
MTAILDARAEIAARATRPDYWSWLYHVLPAGGCTQPIRLRGDMYTVEAETGRILSITSTQDMPDGVIYKPCGNRREKVCPTCSRVYQRDAYQLVRAGLVGGKGVPDTVSTHPAVFVTLTAPGFGPVHTRAVTKHTCTNRKRCDCRPLPCHPGHSTQTCGHGVPVVCFARHEPGDTRLGQPLCADCYDYPAQVAWNRHAGELWRRTTIAINRAVRATATAAGIGPKLVRVSYGKVAEMQRRGVVHFHALVRLDGVDPDNRDLVLPPPAGLGVVDLVSAVEHAASTAALVTKTHPIRDEGWRIAWGAQVDVRVVNAGCDGTITDGMVAGYLSKYATKATEATGHSSRRLDPDTIDVYANHAGSHAERLVAACWELGGPKPWRGLRHWAHMLGFGGHFLTKSRRYSVTFRLLRETRAIWHRTQTTGPEQTTTTGEAPTVLVVNFLEFVGSGWHTTGDAILANTAAAMAREQRQAAREALA